MRASVTKPSLLRRRMSFEAPTTWLLVSTRPSGEMTMPEPSPPRSRLPFRAPVSTRTTAGPTRSVVEMTARE